MVVLRSTEWTFLAAVAEGRFRLFRVSCSEEGGYREVVRLDGWVLLLLVLGWRLKRRDLKRRDLYSAPRREDRKCLSRAG